MVALVNRVSDSRKAERCCLLGAIPSTEKLFPTWLRSVLAGSLETTMLQEGVCCPTGFHRPVSVAAPAHTLNIPLPIHTPTSAQWLSPKAVSLPTDDTQEKAPWLNHSDHFLFHSGSPVLQSPHSAMPCLVIRAVVCMTAPPTPLLGRLSHPSYALSLPGWGVQALSFSPFPHPATEHPVGPWLSWGWVRRQTRTPSLQTGDVRLTGTGGWMFKPQPWSKE